jgi:hypothetical protein
MAPQVEVGRCEIGWSRSPCNWSRSLRHYSTRNVPTVVNDHNTEQEQERTRTCLYTERELHHFLRCCFVLATRNVLLKKRPYIYIVTCMSVTIDGVWFGLVIGFIEHLQNVTANNYSAISLSYTLQRDHCNHSTQSSQSSLAVAWQRFSTGSNGFSNSPLPQIPASHSNSSHRLIPISSLTHWLTNQLTHFTPLTLHCPAYNTSA